MNLDRTSFPAWRERIAAHRPVELGPRSYPGYPRWPLPRGAVRMGLGKALSRRRSAAVLATEQPSLRTLGRLLGAAHPVNGDDGRGPVPSAGCLQALELYVVALTDGGLPAGAYHYDRAAHALAQLVAGVDGWRDEVPSLGLVEGGALLWVLVGDGARVAERYGERARQFLLLEAGHLMQNLCLCGAALGLTTVPLGGFYETPIARRLFLPEGDLVLYAGLAGRQSV